MLFNFLIFGLPGGFEWVVILLGILLLFGGRKIPELMKGIGRGIRDFNDAKDKVKDNIEEGMRDKESGKSSSENSK